MTINIDLKELERKAYRSYFNDGLWDLVLGLTFLILSLVPWLNVVLGLPRPYCYLIIFALLIPVWVGFTLLKKYLTVPRMGLVKFGQERQQKIRKLRIAIGIMVLFTLGLVILASLGYLKEVLFALGNWSSYLLAGAILVVGFSIMAYMLDYARLYFYGWLLAFEYPLSEFFEAQTGLVFPNGATFISLIIITIGLLTLIRFLHQYPLPQSEKA